MIKPLKYGLPCLLLVAGMAQCGGSANAVTAPENGGGDSPYTLVGRVLPDWREGELDIHLINTGRGESLLHILPDGTTLLIDAAGSLLSPQAEIPPTAPKPGAAVSSGAVIVRYVEHFTRPINGKLDYLMLSHFDGDHMGTFSTEVARHPAGDFYLNGVTEVGAALAVDKLIDRGYDFPKEDAGDEKMANYHRFSEWTQTARGTDYEAFEVGSNRQLALRYTPSEYAGFEIRNICGNGRVWTGVGEETVNTFPDDPAEIVSAITAENAFSLGFRLRYGKFDYFSGGDLQYNGRTDYPWKDIEAPVAAVVGEVDVMKANHHATNNCCGPGFMNALRPRTVLINTWRDVQPRPAVIEGMFEARGDCRIFVNNVTAANRERLADHLARLASTDGHIVVRVSPGGEEYRVYILDDTNEDYRVKKVFGPYASY